MRSLAGLIGATDDEVTAFVAAHTRVAECRRCHETVEIVSPAGLCDGCIETVERLERAQGAVAVLPPSLRSVRAKDLVSHATQSPVRMSLRLAMMDRRSVYHYGASGSGKTTLHALAYRALAHRGEVVRWTTAPDLLKTIRSAYSSGGEASDVIDGFVRSARNGWLFIDDLGSERITEWAAEQWSVLADRLYTAGGVRVWITSQYNPDELAARFADRRVAERVVRRLVDLCTAVGNRAPNLSHKFRDADRQGEVV